MAYAFRFDRVSGLALVSFEHVVTGEEIARSMIELFTHAEWRAGMAVLCDFSPASQLVVDFPELMQVVRASDSQWEAARPERKLLVASRDDHFLLARAYSALLQRLGCAAAAYRSMGEALAALGLSALPPALRGRAGSEAA